MGGRKFVDNKTPYNNDFLIRANYNLSLYKMINQTHHFIIRLNVIPPITNGMMMKICRIRKLLYILSFHLRCHLEPS